MTRAARCPQICPVFLLLPASSLTPRRLGSDTTRVHRGALLLPLTLFARALSPEPEPDGPPSFFFPPSSLPELRVGERLATVAAPP